jgi:hypothetical protein
LTGLDDIRDPATNASSFDVLVALRNGLPAECICGVRLRKRENVKYNSFAIALCANDCKSGRRRQK